MQHLIPAPNSRCWLAAISSLQNPASILSYLELIWKDSFHVLPKFTFSECQLGGIFPYLPVSQSLFIPSNRCFLNSLGWRCLTGHPFSVSGSNEMRSSALQNLVLIFKPSPPSIGGGTRMLIIKMQGSSKHQILKLLRTGSIFSWDWNPSFPPACDPYSCWTFMHMAHSISKWNPQ